MQSRILILFGLILFGTIAVAQKKPLPLEGSIQAGLLEGEQGSAFQLSMTGGIKFKTWTTSVGAALDYYGLRSIPLYLNMQKKIFDRTQTPFIYASGGYHFPWVDKESRAWEDIDKTKGGIYFGGGIGYQLQAMKKAALFFSAGYSYKQYEQEITQYSICIGPGPGPCPVYNEKRTYRLRRLSVTTGLRF